jgi:hypothetical protein
LRRIIIITGAVIAVLAAATAAYADLNTYTATIKATPAKAGTAARPVAVGQTVTLAASSGANRAAPLIDIKTTVYGLVSDGKDFPTCSQAKIQAALNDTGCNPKALVAVADVTGVVGSHDLSTAGAPCDPIVDIWNAGQGKVVEFYRTQAPAHVCGGLTTGAAAPFPGTIKQQGKNQIVDIPLPPDVSTNAGNIGLYGSLIAETMNWKKLTIKKHGKTVAYEASVGCKGGSRPYTVSFTAVENGANVTSSVSGKAPCS